VLVFVTRGVLGNVHVGTGCVAVCDEASPYRFSVRCWCCGDIDAQITRCTAGECSRAALGTLLIWYIVLEFFLASTSMLAWAAAANGSRNHKERVRRGNGRGRLACWLGFHPRPRLNGPHVTGRSATQGSLENAAVLLVPFVINVVVTLFSWSL